MCEMAADHVKMQRNALDAIDSHLQKSGGAHIVPSRRQAGTTREVGCRPEPCLAGQTLSTAHVHLTTLLLGPAIPCILIGRQNNSHLQHLFLAALLARSMHMPGHDAHALPVLTLTEGYMFNIVVDKCMQTQMSLVLVHF